MLGAQFLHRSEVFLKNLRFFLGFLRDQHSTSRQVGSQLLLHGDDSGLH
jgi:hypothetical protein